MINKMPVDYTERISDRDTYVCLDLETTGLIPGTDMVIEIGAVKFRARDTLDTFHVLINPGIPLPYFVSRLTGIKQADLDQARPLSDIREELISFIGDNILVGQSMQFDLGFLTAQGVSFDNIIYDTLELAKIILPQQQDYSLAAIAAYFNIHPESPHRALDDAITTKDIFIALVERMKKFEPKLIAEIINMTRNTGWPLYPLFEKYGATEFQDVVDSKEINNTFSSVDIRKFVKEKENKEIVPVNEDEVLTFLSNDGVISKKMPAFEYRQGQVQMAQAVTHSLNNNEHLIVEAGTGTGKSVAYLLPAMLFANKNNCPVVISTNTINLQEQLLNKDIPMLSDILGISGEIRIASLKGRSNYLCLRRWSNFKQKKTLSPEEIGLLVRLLVWLHMTSSGDYAELNLNWTEVSFWEQICARADNCLAEGQCSYHQSGQCLLYQARQKAVNAHIIVTNHALLVSDLITAGKLIPSYDYLIVDEAHHLEEIATEQFGFKINQHILFNHLNLIINKRNDGTSEGLLPELLHLTNNIFISDDERRQIQQYTHEIEAQVVNSRAIILEFFENIMHFIQKNVRRQSGYERRLRLTPAVRQNLSDNSALLTLWLNLDVELAGISINLNKLHDILQSVNMPETNGESNLMSKITSALQVNSELRSQFDSSIAKQEKNTICWLSAREENNSTVTLPEDARNSKNINICAAPLHIGSVFEEMLFNEKKCVILTGATLSIENSFDYIKERLGLREARELLLGSPFDYQTAALLYLPMDIPEPASAGYPQAMGRSLIDLCRASNGHALILFTSHSSLRSIYSIIKTPLEENNILVVGQGINGSARSVLNTFKSNPQTVVLGTNSLWEGVDIAGDSLSVLVITRLPFNVPDDPVHQARAELFEDGFRQYTLPQAIIRFKQGFGRLIRSKTDRGMIVILDQRLQRKYYGEAFIRSLPTCNIKTGHLNEMSTEVMRWL